MASTKNQILLALILLFAIPLCCQTSSTAVTLAGLVGETWLLSNNNLHVWVQNGQNASEVCLGSASFLQKQGVVPHVGDRIEVTGTRLAGGSLLVASSLQIGNKNLQLRQASGTFRCSGCQGDGCGYGCAYGDCDGCAHQGSSHHGHCCDYE